MRIIQSFSIFFPFPWNEKKFFYSFILAFRLFLILMLFLPFRLRTIWYSAYRNVQLHCCEKKKKGKFWITHCHQHEITTKLQRSSKIIWKIPLKFLRLLFTLNHRHGNKSTHQQWIESTISFERRLKIADVVIHGSTFPTLHDCLYPI